MSDWYSLSTLPTGNILIGPDSLERTFRGRNWPLVRTPIWTGGNLLQEGVNGIESRASYRTQPRYKFALKYDEGDEGFLSQDDMQSLVALFNLCRGSVYALTLVMPDDCYVENQQIGYGDGSTKAFQLIRAWGSLVNYISVGSTSFGYTVLGYGFSDSGFRKYGTMSIYKSGVLASTSTWSFNADTGIVTFDTAPASGVIVTATFHYAWRVRFVDDEYSFENFLSGYYSLPQVEFISVGRNE
jgi:hypothetical protein